MRGRSGHFVMVAMMRKMYNIGLVRIDGGKIGFHVCADNSDAAYRKAIAWCDANSMYVESGHLSQRRDSKGNEHFDRWYRILGTLL